MNSTVRITFETVVPDLSSRLIASGRDGFDRVNFSAIDTASFSSTGYCPHSGHSVGLNAYAGTSSFSAAEHFDFTLGYFSAAWDDGLASTVNGYRGGRLVAITTFTAEYGQNVLHQIGKVIHNLDTVEFSTAGGTDRDANDTGIGAHIAMDDTAVTFDTMTVADPLG